APARAPTTVRDHRTNTTAYETGRVDVRDHRTTGPQPNLVNNVKGDKADAKTGVANITKKAIGTGPAEFTPFTTTKNIDTADPNLTTPRQTPKTDFGDRMKAGTE